MAGRWRTTSQDTEQGMMNATGFENLVGSIHADNLTGDDGDSDERSGPPPHGADQRRAGRKF